MKKRKYSWRDPYNSNGYPPLNIPVLTNGGFNPLGISPKMQKFQNQLGNSFGDITDQLSTDENGNQTDLGAFGSAFAKSGFNPITGTIAGVGALINKDKQNDLRKKQEFENNIMQAQQNFMYSNEPSANNIPTFPGGGTLVTPRTDGAMQQRARFINDVGDINDPRLYQSPDSIGSYATVLLRPQGDFQEATVNDLSKSYINNWNQRFGKDMQQFYDPNNPGLKQIRIDNPLYKKMEEEYKSTPNSWNKFYTPPKPTIKLRSGEGSKGYESGGYVIDYKGASHKGGGIPVDGSTGNPSYILGGKPGAEVEDNEIGVKFPNEDAPFIFSDKLGYSKDARKIIKKYSNRPNDKISRDAMFSELGELANAQEEFKAKKTDYYSKKLMKYGGTLNKGLPKYEFGDPIETQDLPQLNLQEESDRPYRGNALGALGTVGANLALLLANRNNKLPDIQMPTITPSTINLEAARTSARQQGVSSRANRIAALRNSGTSPAQYMSVLSAMDSDINRGVNDSVLNSLLQEQQFNAGASQQAKLANAENYMNTQLANRQSKDAFKRQNMQYWQNIAQTIPQYLQQREKYDVLNATNENYDIIKDPTSPWYNPRPKFKARKK